MTLLCRGLQMSDNVKIQNCEVCGIRVQGEGAVACIIDGRCSACGADLRKQETPPEQAEPEAEEKQGGAE